METHRGIVHGKVITLDRAPDLPDGAMVEITVRPAVGESQADAIRRTAGVLAGEGAFFEALDQIRRERRQDTRGDLEEVP